MVDYIRDLRPAKWGSGIKLHGSNLEPLMSALGQKQTSEYVRAMSALPPKADISPFIGLPRRHEQTMLAELSGRAPSQP